MVYCRIPSNKSLVRGTPLVATSVGGIPELFRPGENGKLTPVQNPAVLAETLKRALSKPWSREVVSNSVAEKSWDSVAHEVLSVFRSVITMSCLERI
ncbi:MAG: glycosyltransferase [Phycisphaerae bacterium]|nr:glycosyltransferase [Phycisphaerae bacterium]